LRRLIQPPRQHFDICPSHVNQEVEIAVREELRKQPPDFHRAWIFFKLVASWYIPSMCSRDFVEK
jgi:hypothetical protein